VDVVGQWTGQHANALRQALRLTNEAMATKLGTAVRTVAKWNAEPDLVQSPELQRALDTLLAAATIDDKRRFGLIFAGGVAERSDDDALAEMEVNLANDQAISHALRWLDDKAGWQDGTARRQVARLAREIDARHVRDLTQKRSRVSNSATATFLHEFYELPVNGYDTYRARVAGEVSGTSILTRAEWLDLAAPLGGDRERMSLDGAHDLPSLRLDRHGADAASARLAVGIASGSRMVNAPLYRLIDLQLEPGHVRGTVALTDFVTYALTMDLLEGEVIDTVAADLPPTPASLPLRSRYLPTLEAVTQYGDRLCAGGPLALFAAARPTGRGRPRPDFVLLVQERSGRVLNAAHRLAVIPKAFHQPLTDFSGEARVSATLDREMEEELFGRSEVDSTSGSRHADPLHPSRLSAPFRWLVDNLDAWRMECTGFGLNLVSGNFEFASLIVIEREEWWERYGGDVEANWESDGLRRYSSLDRDLVERLVHDASWSSEGLFAFLQGLRSLSNGGGNRVDLPAIELEF